MPSGTWRAGSSCGRRGTRHRRATAGRAAGWARPSSRSATPTPCPLTTQAGGQLHHVATLLRRMAAWKACSRGQHASDRWGARRAAQRGAPRTAAIGLATNHASTYPAGYITWHLVQALTSYLRGILTSTAIFQGIGVGRQVSARPHKRPHKRAPTPPLARPVHMPGHAALRSSAPTMPRDLCLQSASALGAVWSFFVRDVAGMVGGIAFAAASGRAAGRPLARQCITPGSPRMGEGGCTSHSHGRCMGGGACACPACALRCHTPHGAAHRMRCRDQL